MNLGIEDAWVFCELIKRDKLSRYEKVRKSVDHKVVRRIEFLSRVARGESRMARFARAAILPKALEIGPIHERFQATVTGLDHDIDVEGN